MNFTKALEIIGFNKIKTQEPLVLMNNAYLLHFISPKLKVSKKLFSSLLFVSFCNKRENYNAEPKELLILTHWRFSQGR